MLSVFIAGSAAILAVPRPVEPVEVPLPFVDGRALAQVAEADAARAAALDPSGGRPARALDLDVRALGSAVRAYGLIDAEPVRRDAEIVSARKQVLAAVPAALARGVGEVLDLRAWQQRAFVRAVRHWEVTGEETEDLLALGGDFPELVRRSGWLSADAPGARRVAMDGVVLSVLFKKRWNQVTGLESAPFAPTLDEERALYRFLLSHPLREARPAQGSPRALALRAASERRADEYRLKKIGELAGIDPAYPRDLARGVVLHRLGQHAAAVLAYRRHLEANPDGPYTLRAQNYLRAALESAEGP